MISSPPPPEWQLILYSSTLVKLSRDYKEKPDTARRVCITQLTSAQQAATKAANRDEAVRIRDTIAKLNAELPEPPARPTVSTPIDNDSLNNLSTPPGKRETPRSISRRRHRRIYLNSKNPRGSGSRSMAKPSTCNTTPDGPTGWTLTSR